MPDVVHALQKFFTPMRDAELSLDDDVSKSLIEKMEEGLEHRLRGRPVRLIYDRAMFSITGRARLMDVVKITISPVYDDKLDKKFQLEVKTSLRVLPTELLRKLELIQLPRKLTAEADKDADWSKMPAVSAEDVKNGTRLKPELMQAADEPADRLLLRIPAESGRGLLAAVDKGLPSTAGPQTAQVRRFIMVVRHFPEKKKQLRMDDLLDSAFSTNATTVDMVCPVCCAIVPVCTGDDLRQWTAQ